MNLKNKWIAIAGAVALTGVLSAAGAAMASGGGTAAPTPADRAAKLSAAVQAGKLSQGQADVMQQVDGLRQSAMTKLQADIKAAVDQAVKDGKITQAQADALTSEKGPGAGFGGDHSGGGRGGDHGGFAKLSPTELKAKLDADVKAGKLTQAQADQMLQKMQARAQKEDQEQPDDQAATPAPATPAPATPAPATPAPTTQAQ